MATRRLPIPTCQRILAWEHVTVDERRDPLPQSRYCGKPSVAVNRYEDGREQFVCAEHDDKAAEPGPAWGVHRRGPSALSV